MEVECSSGSDARVAVRTRRRKCGEDWEVMTADGCPLTSLSVCSPDQSLTLSPTCIKILRNSIVSRRMCME